MQHGDSPPGSIPKKRDRIVHRMARFHWENGLVFRRWLDRARKVVPRPDQRAQLVRQVHEELGHFGIRRIHSMLRKSILVGRYAPGGSSCGEV